MALKNAYMPKEGFILHRIIVLALLLGAAFPVSAEKLSVDSSRMNIEFIGAFSQDDYMKGVLAKALELTEDDFGPFNISIKPPAPEWREINLISSKPELMRVAVTSRPHEIRDQELLKMIHVPLMRGSFGFRVCVSSQEHAEKLEEDFNSGDLSNVLFGAGYKWSDVDILRLNGLRVAETGYDQKVDSAIGSLYKMTARGRVDAFCRGINEILKEKPYYEKSPDLALNTSHVIVYEMPFFLFLHQDNAKLYERITLGFKRMLDTGIWEKHWEEHLGDSLRFTQLSERKIIRLNTKDAFYDSEEYRSYLFFDEQ